MNGRRASTLQRQEPGKAPRKAGRTARVPAKHDLEGKSATFPSEMCLSPLGKAFFLQ